MVESKNNEIPNKTIINCIFIKQDETLRLNLKKESVYAFKEKI